MLQILILTWILAANGWTIPTMVWVTEGVLLAIKWLAGFLKSVAIEEEQ